MARSKTMFAAYPSAVVFDRPSGKKKALQHLLWGDWLRAYQGSDDLNGGFRRVKARGVEGWMREEDIQKNRLMEVVFVDIGQGDGCLLVTPDDKHFVIDAGQEDNMYRFLRWRYGGFEKPWSFKGGVISHPDADHYKGFTEIFEDNNVTFETIFHSGIMETKDKGGLGRKIKRNGRSFLDELINNIDDLRAFLAQKKRWKGKQFPGMLNKGLENNRFANYDRLGVSTGHLPGYGPNDERSAADRDVTIEILGPIEEPNANGKPQLRWLVNKGKTKNGHSVVLKLVYRNVSILLGGDLNIPSERLLLAHHTGLRVPPRTGDAEKRLIEAARTVFQVDIAKSCHHGSSDFSSLFLAATNPLATVISSGDNEAHSHPRSDALGAIGKFSRGARPLIFSTELARSTKDNIRHPYKLRSEIKGLKKQIEAAKNEHEGNEDKRKKVVEKLEKKFDKALEKIERSVAVYGAIQLRTDGHNVVLAQKIESPRRKDRKWDIYRLESTPVGTLSYVSKY